MFHVNQGRQYEAQGQFHLAYNEYRQALAVDKLPEAVQGLERLLKGDLSQLQEMAIGGSEEAATRLLDQDASVLIGLLFKCKSRIIQKLFVDRLLQLSFDSPFNPDNITAVLPEAYPLVSQLHSKDAWYLNYLLNQDSTDAISWFLKCYQGQLGQLELNFNSRYIKQVLIKVFDKVEEKEVLEWMQDKNLNQLAVILECLPHTLIPDSVIDKIITTPVSEQGLKCLSFISTMKPQIVYQKCHVYLKEACTSPWKPLASLVLSKCQQSVDVQVFLQENAAEYRMEALAYLSLNPQVKETLVAVNILDQLKLDDAYGCALLLSNLVRFRKPLSKQEKEILELQKLSEQKSLDPLDDDEHVKKRCKILVSKGIFTILGKLSGSPQVSERISETLVSIARDASYHGLLLQQYGMKRLIQLIQNNTDQGREMAAQTLAKITIRLDPSILFKDPTVVVKPLASLLSSQSTLCQFEGLMALTNLASIPSCQPILWSAHNSILHLQLSDHSMVQRAATELVCNLITFEKALEFYCKSDLKVLFALCDVDDKFTRRAAAGALAMLSEVPEGALAISKHPRCTETITRMLTEDQDMVHRAFVICLSLQKSSLLDHSLQDKIAKIKPTW